MTIVADTPLDNNFVGAVESGNAYIKVKRALSQDIDCDSDILANPIVGQVIVTCEDDSFTTSIVS